MNAAENVVTFVRPAPRPPARPAPSDRARAERVSLVVHDFRQPLNVIQLSATALLAHAASDGKVPVELERIRRAVTTLARMTDDLLDVSAFEARGLTLERVPVRIAALTTEAIACVPGLAARCEIRVSRDVDVVVFADPARIVQVLANLLANAAKYGDSCAPIEVDVTRRQCDACVAVSNRGPGIPASELPYVFERFYRGAGARVERPGLGLGLTIAKAIIEAHSGRIWAESFPGDVTRCAFTLPLGAVR
ncbi:MAG: HAMP domain-containing histidine kinase [Myxococcota bacterium]|nr:HAMP domain-containing histidine kinase [Myxococcota bacterium]